MSQAISFKKHGGARANTGKKLSMEVRDKLEAVGCDPILGMAYIAMANPGALAELGLLVTIPGQDGQEAQVTSSQQIPIELRAAMYRELAQYVYPKRRSVDVDVQGGGDIHVNVLNFSAQELGYDEPGSGDGGD